MTRGNKIARFESAGVPEPPLELMLEYSSNSRRLGTFLDRGRGGGAGPSGECKMLFGEVTSSACEGRQASRIRGPRTLGRG